MKFVMEYEQVSFNEAASRLADMASVNIKKPRRRPVNQTVKKLEQAGRAVEALELAELDRSTKKPDLRLPSSFDKFIAGPPEPIDQ